MPPKSCLAGGPDHAMVATGVTWVGSVGDQWVTYERYECSNCPHSQDRVKSSTSKD